MQNQWENQGPGQQGPPQGGPGRQGGPVPPNPVQGYWKRMWHVWGPFLIRWLIGMVTSYAATMVYMILYHYKEIEALMSQPADQNGMNEFLLSITKELLGYSTQITGAAALVTIPVMLILFHMDRRKEKRYGIVQNKKAPIWKYTAVIGISAAMCIGLNNLIIIGNLAAADSTYAETTEALYSAPFNVQILCLVILTPIAEELVFRGLIFKRLREQSGFLQAAVYSSLIFGIMHGNLVQMLYGFILGMMLAYVYEKYGSVKAPVAAHIVMNAISVVGTKYQLFDWMMEDILRIGGITVACAAIASTMFVLIQRIEEKPELPHKPGEKENLAAV